MIRPAKAERCVILPIVLVAVMLLSMLALTFGFMVRAELSGVSARGSFQQARLSATSGLECAALLLRQHFTDTDMWYNNRELFFNRIVYSEGAEETLRAYRFSLIGYNLDRDDSIRFGMTDEASKVNINVASGDQLRRLLGQVAELGMEGPLVSALLDWREPGELARPDGAKDLHYMMLPQPYRCKKGAFDTIEELLLVRGFDSAIVYGEDMNRNGILDPNEDDGDDSLPLDNGDGVLDRGLYPYITVYSREAEMTDSNPYMPRINISILPEQARGRIRDEVVDFMTKARNAGANFGKSPAELIGLTYTEGDAKKTSPATEADLPELMDALTTGYHGHDDGYVYGRINVNTAPRTVLRTIGKLTSEQIDSILSIRNSLTAEQKNTTAWLVQEGAMSIEEYKDVAYLFTARSYQFMVESVGYSDYDGAQCRLQAVLDLRLPRVQYVYFRDMSGLGISYALGEFEQEDDIIIEEVSSD